jgi:hypothetical protein
MSKFSQSSSYSDIGTAKFQQGISQNEMNNIISSCQSFAKCLDMNEDEYLSKYYPGKEEQIKALDPNYTVPLPVEKQIENLEEKIKRIKKK